MALTQSQGQPSDNRSTDFTGASIPNRIGYRFIDLDPGSNIYVQRDDILVLQWMSSRVGGDSINLGVRLLVPARVEGRTQPDPSTVDNALGDSPYGQIIAIQEQFSTTTLNTVITNTIPLAEGYLMSVSMLSTGAVERGITFAKAFLVRGASSVVNTTYVLAADYCTIFSSIGWPVGRVISPIETKARLDVITVANPAAGADWTFIVPLSTRVRITSIQATLTASAAVANRNIQLQLFDTNSGTNYGTYPANLSLVATNVGSVSAAPSITPSALIPLNVQISLPADLYLRNDTFGDMRLRSLTQNIQAADQWSAISVGVERWLDF